MNNNVCRYKVKLEISDPTAAATCVLFDKEAQMIINESADSIITLFDRDSKELPKPIQKICGQTLIFQFRLTEYNLKSFRPDYTVSRIFFPKEKGNSRIDMANVKKVTNLDYYKTSSPLGTLQISVNFTEIYTYLTFFFV